MGWSTTARFTFFASKSEKQGKIPSYHAQPVTRVKAAIITRFTPCLCERSLEETSLGLHQTPRAVSNFDTQALFGGDQVPLRTPHPTSLPLILHDIS